MHILVVDDEQGARRTLIRLLGRMGDITVEEASSLAAAQTALASNSFDGAFIDLQLGAEPENRDGLSLVQALRTHHQTAIIVVSGWGDMENIRSAMRQGAYAYVVKDELREELVLPIIEELRRRRALESEVTKLRARTRGEMPEIVGNSAAMQRLRASIQRVSLSDRTVLVTGPTGSGKELVVRAIHVLGPNPGQPMLDLNCGALPGALIESQLFGHERGAFTGADRAHEGFFTAVGQGTLFLDEIAELPLDLQAKLLRVLETGTYRPVGSQKVLRFRGRVVAATHADLSERVRENRFREDLYYRINVLEIPVPGLDERREDIVVLATHFAQRQPSPVQLTAGALEFLRTATWPGNVRQLRNLIDRIAVFAPDPVVDAATVQQIMGSPRPAASALKELAQRVLDLDHPDDKLRLVEQLLVNEALRRADGNKSVAARYLGVQRKVIERRLKRDTTKTPGVDQNS